MCIVAHKHPHGCCRIRGRRLDARRDSRIRLRQTGRPTVLISQMPTPLRPHPEPRLEKVSDSSASVMAAPSYSSRMSVSVNVAAGLTPLDAPILIL
jgi:hypothetical protein